MKKTLIAGITLILGASAIAQTDVTLKLNHNFNGTPFVYDDWYEADNGVDVRFNRVQYYLSNVSLKHDGGQYLGLTDTYVLASSNITDYNLGSHDISSLEGIKFDLGVDQTNNHVGSSSFAAGHPLSAQSPLMDWGWPAGYFFFVIDGDYDSDGDGTADGFFSMRGLGDELLVSVDELAHWASGSAVDLNVDVNIADWVKDIDLTQVGSQHNASPDNVAVKVNTNTETVFTTTGVASINESSAIAKNQISFDYQLPYAPTIFYSIKTESALTLSIVDMQGKVVLQQSGLNKDGNFFINKELNTGMYTAVFSNSQVKETAKFTVTQ